MDVLNAGESVYTDRLGLNVWMTRLRVNTRSDA